MPIRDGAKVLSNAFEDGAEDEYVVEDGQKDQDPVENGAEFLGEEDRNCETIAENADETDDDLTDAVQGIRQLSV